MRLKKFLIILFQPTNSKFLVCSPLACTRLRSLQRTERIHTWWNCVVSQKYVCKTENQLVVEFQFFFRFYKSHLKWKLRLTTPGNKGLPSTSHQQSAHLVSPPRQQPLRVIKHHGKWFLAWKQQYFYMIGTKQSWCMRHCVITTPTFLISSQLSSASHGRELQAPQPDCSHSWNCCKLHVEYLNIPLKYHCI